MEQYKVISVEPDSSDDIVLLQETLNKGYEVVNATAAYGASGGMGGAFVAHVIYILRCTKQ